MLKRLVTRGVAIAAAVVLLLAVLWAVDQWAPDWRDEARVLLQQLFRRLR